MLSLASRFDFTDGMWFSFSSFTRSLITGWPSIGLLSE